MALLMKLPNELEVACRKTVDYITMIYLAQTKSKNDQIHHQHYDFNKPELSTQTIVFGMI